MHLTLLYLLPSDAPSYTPCLQPNTIAHTPLVLKNSQALEAQDNEMMAPFCVGHPTYIDPRRPGQRMCPQGRV